MVRPRQGDPALRVQARARARALACTAAVLALVAGPARSAAAQQEDRSLRFYGTGADDVDRVKIPLDGPVNVGGAFTVELFLKAEPGANDTGTCEPSDSKGDGWINGNIVVDRDVFGDGDRGDYGMALYGADGGRIAFGVAVGGDGVTLCGGDQVADGQWHHVAGVRTAEGRVRLFVDGALVAEADGPGGDVAYRNGRGTDYPGSDPYLVLGAEKHDAGSDYPSFHGWVDEIRVSDVARYEASATVPTSPFLPDEATVALFHADEGGGDSLGDSSGAAGGPSNGTIRYGGDAGGPTWDVGALAATAPAPTTTAPPAGSTSPPPDSTAPPPATTATTSPATSPAPPTTGTPPTSVATDSGSGTSWLLPAAGLGIVAASAVAVVLVLRSRRSA